ncbi:Solute carrier family 23 member 2 [Armadillidium vulgare]|nr:Solute carrier family 23 member 2 [Armadillidium vulgare]
MLNKCRIVIMNIVVSLILFVLPVIQGATFAFLLPTIAIMNTSFNSCQTYDYSNLTSDEKDEIWMRRMRAIQGAVTVASVTEVFIGLTELELLIITMFDSSGASQIVGFMASWITPLTIVPTIALWVFPYLEPQANKGFNSLGNISN